MVWTTFWLPKPSRRPSRTHPTETSTIDADFYRFCAVLAIPGGPKIDEKQLRRYPAQLLFWLQKRFCCEVGLEDAILDDCGFQNVNLGFQNVNFGRDFVLFFICFWVLHQQQPCKLQDIMCLGTLCLAKPRSNSSSSSTSSSSTSSLARDGMSCNILSCESQQHLLQIAAAAAAAAVMVPRASKCSR